MNVPMWFGIVVMPMQQEMESWCLCVSGGLRVSGTCSLGAIMVCAAHKLADL